MSSPPAQTQNPSAELQSPPTENFLATVLYPPLAVLRITTSKAVFIAGHNFSITSLDVSSIEVIKFCRSLNGIRENLTF